MPPASTSNTYHVIAYGNPGVHVLATNDEDEARKVRDAYELQNGWHPWGMRNGLRVVVAKEIPPLKVT